MYLYRGASANISITSKTRQITDSERGDGKGNSDRKVKSWALGPRAADFKKGRLKTGRLENGRLEKGTLKKGRLKRGGEGL